MSDFFLLAIIIVAIVGLEIIALSIWHRWYFTHGIKIFSSSGNVQGNIDDLLPANINIGETGNSDSPNILCRKINENLYLLREEMLHFNKKHSGIIRVNIKTDAAAKHFVLSGYLNLASFLPLLLFIYLISFVNDRDMIMAFIVFSVFIVITTIIGFRSEIKKFKLLVDQIKNTQSE